MSGDWVLKNRIVIIIITIKLHSEKAVNVGCGTFYPDERQRVYKINPLKFPGIEGTL
jgi:hypothetical protein